MLMRIPIRGYFEVNCFFCIDGESNHGFIIDPGAQAVDLLRVIEEHHWTIEKILLTHGHFDHIGAVDTHRETLHIPVLAHEKSASYLSDPTKNLSYYCGQPITVSATQKVARGERIALQANPTFALTVLYTPGPRTQHPTIQKLNTQPLWGTPSLKAALAQLSFQMAMPPFCGRASQIQSAHCPTKRSCSPVTQKRYALG
ncbi:MAG: MBL fold metallo-hydrolase [Desulfovibrionaceae bacterium]|nr:MBL fold metallo-hydrolase [Desulfovibrionaceae bacterium]